MRNVLHTQIETRALFPNGERKKLLPFSISYSPYEIEHKIDKSTYVQTYRMRVDECDRKNKEKSFINFAQITPHRIK